MKSFWKIFFTTSFVVAALFVFLGGSFFVPAASYDSKVAVVTASTGTKGVPIEKKEELPQVAHVPTPEAVKAIYMSQCVVGTPSFRDKLVKLADDTEINSIIIDVKDYTGTIAFESTDPALAPSVSEKCGARDMAAFLKKLHEKGIYAIARVTVFQDPYYTHAHPELAIKKASAQSTIWKDRKGLAFIDVGAKPFWDYIITLAKASYDLGFDEINFDYIRYPSDGDLEDIYFPWSHDKEKQVALEEFFSYLQKGMEGTGAKTSADIFGMTTVNYHDMNIGQVLERAMPHFDYIAPMVYPSHFPPKFNGWANPNTVPGPVIAYTMAEALKRAEATSSKIQILGSKPVMRTVTKWTAETGTTTSEVATGLFTKEVYDQSKFRPWLQDFDFGGGYDAADVRAQIDATNQVGIKAWFLWDPGNIYTREALHVEQ